MINFGIDFGGVIVKPANDNNHFDPTKGLEIEQDGAIAAMQHLISISDNTSIISKASKTTERQTRQWLDLVSFYQKTNFNPANLIFCAKRADKIQICQSLNITHFLDDNLDTVKSLIGIVPNLYFFGSQSENTEIISIENWAELILLGVES